MLEIGQNLAIARQNYNSQNTNAISKNQLSARINLTQQNDSVSFKGIPSLRPEIATAYKGINRAFRRLKRMCDDIDFVFTEFETPKGLTFCKYGDFGFSPQLENTCFFTQKARDGKNINVINKFEYDTTCFGRIKKKAELFLNISSEDIEDVNDLRESGYIIKGSGKIFYFDKLSNAWKRLRDNEQIQKVHSYLNEMSDSTKRIDYEEAADDFDAQDIKVVIEGDDDIVD